MKGTTCWRSDAAKKKVIVNSFEISHCIFFNIYYFIYLTTFLLYCLFEFLIDLLQNSSVRIPCLVKTKSVWDCWRNVNPGHGTFKFGSLTDWVRDPRALTRHILRHSTLRAVGPRGAAVGDRRTRTVMVTVLSVDPGLPETFWPQPEPDGVTAGHGGALPLRLTCVRWVKGPTGRPSAAGWSTSDFRR